MVGKCVKEVFFLRGNCHKKLIFPKWRWPLRNWVLSHKTQYSTNGTDLQYVWGGKWNKTLFWLQRCDDKLGLCKFCLQSQFFHTPPLPLSFYSLHLTFSFTSFLLHLLICLLPSFFSLHVSSLPVIINLSPSSHSPYVSFNTTQLIPLTLLSLS